jgi:small subunit ribosomal protein S20
LANTRSAKKRIRQTARRRARNRIFRTRARSYVKQARTMIDAGEAATEASIRQAVSQLDRAASRGVIHPNNAARRKRRLARHLAASKKTE